MAETISQYQIATFTSPVNGTTPINANTVRGNDNTVRTSHNAHDADPGVHLQSSALAARPAAGTAGRKWLTTDGLRVYYDTGATWSEVDYLCKAAGGTVAGATTFSSTVAITGDASGGLAVGGDAYNHVLVAIGLNNHPLQETHQVGVYSALKANSYAAGAGSFNAGFESAIGTQAGAFTLEAAANYTVGSLTKGAGSTITRSWGLATYEESAADHNATIAPLDATFTGNWFIYYPHTRASYLGGALTVVGAVTLSGSEVFSGDGTSYLRIAGGASAGDGAVLQLSGPTHATVPGRVYLSATGTGSVVLRAGIKELTLDSSGGLAAPATVTVSTAFGCNGKTAQSAYAVGAAATDLASVVTLANNIRTALINNGIAS